MPIVYYFFNAKTKHHVPRIMESFNYFQNSIGKRACFVLLNYSQSLDSYYSRFKKKMDIIFISSKLELIKFFLVYGSKRDTVFVLQGLDKTFLITNFLFLLRKNIVLWANWGSGLRVKDSFTGKIEKLLKSLLFMRIDRINTLMQPDALDLKNNYHYKKTISVCRLFNSQPITDKSLYQSYFTDSKINILVGNHIGKTNHHIDVFNIIQKFKEENIRVIVFAGYYNQDKEYVEKVLSHGEEIFGRKFYAFKNLIDFKTYLSVMKSVDILIIPTEHQTGLGAINQVSFYGGNIFLKKNGKNDLFAKEIGLTTFTIEDIFLANKIEDLMKIENYQKENNFLIIRKRRENNELFKCWFDFVYKK